VSRQGAPSSESGAMLRALELAALGRRTFPNPMVGAVVLKDGRIVGEGYHSCCGGPHAEVLALREAGGEARGGTLVVTLEPCCHTGRTGPCVAEIVAAGISKVVAAMEDPDPRVDGGGLRALREAGVEASCGMMGSEAARLNQAYLCYLETGRSLLVLKMAVTLDGRIAAPDGSSRWISGEASRAEVARMRASSQAVLVGANTVRLDNPALGLPTDPSGSGDTTPPVRIVVTRSGRLAPNSSVFDGSAPTVVAVPDGLPGSAEAVFEDNGAAVWHIPAGPGGLDLGALLRMTAAEGLGSVLCEGGASLATSLIREGLAARVAFFVASAILGGEGRASLDALGISSIGGALRLSEVRHTPLGPDVLVEGSVVYRSR